MLFGEEIERCRSRRILAWEELERYGNAKVILADGRDIKSVLIERAEADIELMDFLIRSLDAAAAAKLPLPK